MVVVVLVVVGGLVVVVVLVVVEVVVAVLVVDGGLVVVVVLVVVEVVVAVLVAGRGPAVEGGLPADGGSLADEEPATDCGTDEGALLSDEGWDVVLDGRLADDWGNDVLLSADWLPGLPGLDDVLLVSDASESELPPPQAAAAKATDNAAASSLICALLCPLRVLIIPSYCRTPVIPANTPVTSGGLCSFLSIRLWRGLRGLPRWSSAGLSRRCWLFCLNRI